MAAPRHKTIKRAPDMGLTLKMQSQSAPCVPAPTGARWYNEATGEWDLITMARATNSSSASYENPVLLSGELDYDTGFPACQRAREMYVARILGPLCDAAVDWDWDWVAANPIDEGDENFYIQPAGAAIAVNVLVPAYGGHPAGVLSLTPAIDGAALNPVYLTLAEAVSCCE